MKGDLHCHTKNSDGSLSPEALVDLAARLTLSCIAVTDHDTMNGVVAAEERAVQAGITLLPGIEISSYDYVHHKKVHILCYLPKKPQALLELCRETLRRRTNASLRMIEKIAARYPIDVETVKKYADGSAAIYKQHIAYALMDRGYSLSIFGELYSSLFSAKSGGWALVESKVPDFHEAFTLAKETGGAVVLAHPGVYQNFDIIEELCEMGLDGIEVWHPRQTETDTKRALEAATQHHLIRTGGSDFHGMSASKVTPLGTRTAEDDELASLITRFQ